MNPDRRWYTEEGSAARVLQEYDAGQAKNRSSREVQVVPALTVVRETGERAAQAVRGLERAYSDEGDDDSDERIAPASERSAQFERIVDDEGRISFTEIDPTAPEQLQQQLAASSAEAMRLMKDHAQAMLDMDQADQEIAQIRGRLRQLGEESEQYADEDFAARASQLNQEIQDWQAWRDGRARSVERYSRMASQNDVRASGIREMKTTREAQASLEAKKAEYQNLFQRSEAYWEALQDDKTASEQLQARLADIMNRTVVLPPRRAEASPSKKGFWSFLRRGSSEASRPTESVPAAPEVDQEMKDILGQIAAQNQKSEAILAAKEANDRRMHELGEQIQAIENPSSQQAA